MIRLSIPFGQGIVELHIPVTPNVTFESEAYLMSSRSPGGSSSGVECKFKEPEKFKEVAVTKDKKLVLKSEDNLEVSFNP